MIAKALLEKEAPFSIHNFFEEDKYMKRNLKSLVVTGITAVLLAASLTGCGSSSSGAASSDGAVTLDSIKAAGKLSVATEAAYEPFEYMDVDGETIIGYNADLFQLICDDLGVELNYIDLPFQGILSGLEAKKYDVVGATLGITAERAAKYSMTHPIESGTNVFIKRADDDSIATVADMAGKVVATQTSCYNETDTIAYNDRIVSEGGEGYAELKTYDGFPEAYTELRNGQVDLVAQNYASACAMVLNNPDVYALVLDDTGAVAEVSEIQTWLGWAVRQEDVELYDYINSEIDKFKADGTLAELQTKWFGATLDCPSENYIPE